MSDVVIIGGGVIGLTAAYVLSKRGVNVTVLEKNYTGRESSWAGAGMLPSFLPDEELSSFAKMFKESRKSWPIFSRELYELTGVDNEYHVCGALTLKREPEASSVEHWTSLDIEEKSPYLKNEISDLWYYPEYAQVRNPRQIQSLIEALKKLKVNMIENCEIHRLILEQGRVRSLVTSQGEISAGEFLIAAGAWSGKLLMPIGYDLNVKPIRGQILLYHWENSPVKMVIDMGKQYVVPRLDGHLLIGSTEEDVGFDKGTTVWGIETLKEFAEDLIPGLKEKKPVRSWSGLRPYHAGKLPLIGKLPNHENLWIATGHFRWGLQLSYETAVSLTDYMFSRNPPLVKIDVNSCQ